MSACGKHRHATRADADSALRSLMRNAKEPKRRKKRLCVYPCKQCSGFHIGHSRMPRRKKVT
jgi:hypothetical protein